MTSDFDYEAFLQFCRDYGEIPCFTEAEWGDMFDVHTEEHWMLLQLNQ